MTEVSKRTLMLQSPVLVIVKTNPKKPNSMAHERFENYFKLPAGATVEQALKAGVRMDDIRHDSAHGFIVVGEADIKAQAEAAAAQRLLDIEAAKALLAEVEAEAEEKAE